MTGDDPPDEDAATGRASEPAGDSARGWRPASLFESSKLAFGRAIEFRVSAIQTASGWARSGSLRERRGVCGGGGGAFAAGLRSLTGEQVSGVVVMFTSTKARNGVEPCRC
jgi:hypothetical protein